MAIGYDTSAQAVLGTTAVSLAYTCGATAKLLTVFIVGATVTNRTTDAPTYNSVVLTRAGISQAGAAECNSELWYMLNPPTGASYNIVVDNDGALSLRVMAASFTGAGIALFGTPVQTGASASVPSLTINSVPAGGLCVSVLGHGDKGVPTARSHTLIYSNDEGAWSSNSQYGLIATTGNVTMTWTMAASDDVAMIIAAFQETVPPINLSGLVQAITVCSNEALNVVTYKYFEGLSVTLTDAITNIYITRILSADSYATTSVIGEITFVVTGIFFEGVIYSISGTDSALLIERNLTSIVVDLSYAEASFNVTRNITSESISVTNVAGNLFISIYPTGFIYNITGIDGNISIQGGVVFRGYNLCYQDNTFIVLGIY